LLPSRAQHTQRNAVNMVAVSQESTGTSVDGEAVRAGGQFSTQRRCSRRLPQCAVFRLIALAGPVRGVRRKFAYNHGSLKLRRLALPGEESVCTLKEAQFAVALRPPPRTPARAQSLIGIPKHELDTPALCIDLDVMETNIRAMAGYIQSCGKQWRPHEKCHKTPAIALKQMEAGAIGVTCAKVSEAEVMAAGGIRDILIANMIVGPRKWERVASLCRWADPIVACDHYAQIEPLAEVCRRHGVAPRVIIEVNIGLDRVGSRPGRDTLELAEGIDRLKGVRFAASWATKGTCCASSRRKKSGGRSARRWASCSTATT